MLVGDLRAEIPTDWQQILEEGGVPAEVINLLRKCVAASLERRLPNAMLLAKELAKLCEL